MSNKKYLSFFFVVAFMIFPLYASAAKGAATNNAKFCLACHADKTLTKKLMNKEILSLYIDANEFGKSVHASTGCGGCHPDITMENHPVVKKIASRNEYCRESLEKLLPMPYVGAAQKQIADSQFPCCKGNLCWMSWFAFHQGSCGREDRGKRKPVLPDMPQKQDNHVHEKR